MDGGPIATGGASGSVNVTAPGGCAWTATSNAAWISITGGSGGNRNGTVTYTVAANPGAGRSGTFTISGQTFTVNQAAPAVGAIPTVGGVSPASGSGASQTLTFTF